MAIEHYTPSFNSLRYGFGGTLIWQTFKTWGNVDRLGYVNLPLTRLGSVAGSCTAYIYATSGGYPTGSSLGSATYTANSITTGLGTYYTFDFTDIAISPHTVYAIVFNGNSTSGSNYIGWDTAQVNGYGNGTGGYKYSGGGWVNYGFDFGFQAYMYQSAVAPTVTTGSVSSITTSGATVAGNVTSDGGSGITQRGVCYVKGTGTPTTGNSKKTTTGTTGSYSVGLTGLLAGTTYSARAYAINALGTSYGVVTSFTTTAVAPSITSSGITNGGAISFKASANVTSNGGEAVTERGFAYDTSTAPTTGDSIVTSGTGTGAFSSTITGLTVATPYFVRPYATNSIGTTYGTEMTFTTLDTVEKWAQSFTSTATGVLSKIELYLKLLSGSSGTVKISIHEDDAGSPGTKLGTLPPVVITNTTYEWIELTSDISITDTDVYWIVLEEPYVIGSYQLNWGANSAGGYAGGAIKYTKSSAPTTWINTSYSSHDSAFKVYMQPTFTPDYDIKISGRKRYL